MPGSHQNTGGDNRGGLRAGLFTKYHNIAQTCLWMCGRWQTVAAHAMLWGGLVARAGHILGLCRSVGPFHSAKLLFFFEQILISATVRVAAAAAAPFRLLGMLQSENDVVSSVVVPPSAPLPAPPKVRQFHRQPSGMWVADARPRLDSAQPRYRR